MSDSLTFWWLWSLTLVVYSAQATPDDWLGWAYLAGMAGSIVCLCVAAWKRWRP